MFGSVKRRADDGDFDAFVAARHRALLAIASRILLDRNAAQDVLQECWIKTFKSWPRIRGMDQPELYVRRILVNQCMDHFKGSKRAGIPRDTLADLQDVPQLSHHEPEERDRIWRLLGELTPQQRAAVVLRYYEDLPDDQIATLLSVTQATVRSHVRNGLMALSQRLSSVEGGS